MTFARGSVASGARLLMYVKCL